MLHWKGQDLYPTTRRPARTVPRELHGWPPCTIHFKLCKAILIASRDQLGAVGTSNDGVVGIMESGQEHEALAVMLVQIAPEIVDDKVYQMKDPKGSIMNVQIGSEAVYRDDLIGQILNPELERIARAKELEYVEARVVFGETHDGGGSSSHGKTPSISALGRRD